MYTVMICHDNKMKCTKCKRKIGIGNRFYGFTLQGGELFDSPVCNECFDDIEKNEDDRTYCIHD